MNGRFGITRVTSYGCLVAAELNGGYAKNGNPPGYFANGSFVAGILGIYGTNAQADGDTPKWPACTPCGSENTGPNYEIKVTEVVAEGFPAPSNRTECVEWARWKPWHCFYNTSRTPPPPSMTKSSTPPNSLVAMGSIIAPSKAVSVQEEEKDVDRWGQDVVTAGKA